MPLLLVIHFIFQIVLEEIKKYKITKVEKKNVVKVQYKKRKIKSFFNTYNIKFTFQLTVYSTFSSKINLYLENNKILPTTICVFELKKKCMKGLYVNSLYKHEVFFPLFLSFGIKILSKIPGVIVKVNFEIV